MQRKKSAQNFSTPPEGFESIHLAMGCWECGGGLSEVLAQLALAQAKRGLRVAIIYLDLHAPHPLLRACKAAGVHVFALPQTGKNAFGFSFSLLTGLPKLLRFARQLYIHGCWTFPVLWGSFCAKRVGVPVTIFPHGSLHPTALTKTAWGKRFIFALYNRRALQNAARICVCSEMESVHVRNCLGETCPPLTLIPNGVDGAAIDLVPDQPKEKTLLYIGRLHPLKGLDLLIEAWKRLAPPEPWQLKLIGPLDGYTPTDLPPGVSYEGPLYGAEKFRLLKSAHGLILPSRGENFGIVIAEALRCRTPAICTTEVPWDLPAPYRVKPEVEDLQSALQHLISQSPEALETTFAPLYTSVKETLDWNKIEL